MREFHPPPIGFQTHFYDSTHNFQFTFRWKRKCSINLNIFFFNFIEHETFIFIFMRDAKKNRAHRILLVSNTSNSSAHNDTAHTNSQKGETHGVQHQSIGNLHSTPTIFNFVKRVNEQQAINSRVTHFFFCCVAAAAATVTATIVVCSGLLVCVTCGAQSVWLDVSFRSKRFAYQPIKSGVMLVQLTPYHIFCRQ